MLMGMDGYTPGPLPFEVASGILLAYLIIAMIRQGHRLWGRDDCGLAVGVWLLFGGFGAAFICAGLGVLPW